MGVARGDLITHGGATIDMAFVAVGSPGNAGELSGAGAWAGEGPDAIVGAVAHEYRIGTYEVTAGQYATFLNAAAASDPYGLYTTSMDSQAMGCQITRVGSSGSYTYDFSGGTVEAPGSTAADWENRPVNYVSWYDAARFCNWLTSGDSETGAYVFSGGIFQNITDRTLAAITYGTVYYIPTEDEWYKAAYYDPSLNGGAGGYWVWPTNAFPGRDMTEGTNPGANANYYTTSYLLGAPYYRTNVGEFELSTSPFGTFDQGGNVMEWNEHYLIERNGGIRGGSYRTYYTPMRASDRYYSSTPPPPTYESDGLGFRVASFSIVPEPGSLGLLGVVLAGLVARRRRDR